MKRILQRKTIFKVLICIVWLGLIFYNRTRQGKISQKSSKEIASKFVSTSTGDIDKPGVQFSDINFYVRKNAHFFQYLVLSGFMCAAVRHFKLYKSTKIFLIW